MKKINLIITAIAFFSLLAPIGQVSAQAGGAAGPTATGGDSVLCEIFPFLRSIGAVSSICTGSEEAAEDAAEQIRNFIQLGLSLVFVGIIAISIFVIIRAALKYIRSEGEPDKIQDAQKAIKSVFIGIGAL